MMELNKIYHGNCMDIVKSMPDNFIDCVVTSPPYYGLRDYGTDDQFGLEDTPELFVQNLVNLFREIRRVLKDTGTVWLNLGDSYAGNNSRASNNGRAGFGNERETIVNRGGDGLKPKDLIGIPWMVAFALRADGWYLRQDIIWHKPNPMPESVTDRCTKSHEYIFLLSKSQRYYYDAEAIKENAKYGINGDDERPAGVVRNREYEYNSKENNYPHAYRKADPRAGKGRIAYEGKRTQNTNGNNGQQSFVAIEEKRNKRSVWTITTKPFKDAHFATFPTELITPCILAGCPVDGLVLDPFGGAGTTAVVAKGINRNYILCELNKDYIDISEKRINKHYGLFA
jgi:DNA modification methylase